MRILLALWSISLPNLCLGEAIFGSMCARSLTFHAACAAGDAAYQDICALQAMSLVKPIFIIWFNDRCSCALGAALPL